MNRKLGVVALLVCAAVRTDLAYSQMGGATAGGAGVFSVIPQDKGIPYTRSGRPAALERIRGVIAVCGGSRYGYVRGHKVRLDAQDVVGGEAVVRDGVVFVPEGFAGLVQKGEVRFDEAPAYLADRWVYSPERGKVEIGGLIAAGIRTAQVEGKRYVSFEDLARSAGLKVAAGPGAVVMAGETLPDAGAWGEEGRDGVVVLFDTPEKFADPSLAAKYMPVLKRQGEFTTHVKVTPEQLAVLNGTEVPHPGVPAGEYDLTGFQTALLGSAVPPTGVYPRVLFSPEDVAGIAARIKGSKYGQMSLIEQEVLLKKSWLDETTSDGQIFKKLWSGDLAGLTFPDSGPNIHPGGIPHTFVGQKPGIYNSHVAYVPECLTTMALWCLIEGDDALGRKVATAIANFYKLREPYVDEWSGYSDSEFGGTTTRPDGRVLDFVGNGGETHWRGMHGNVASMNVALALDFAGKWMSDEQKALMYRVIAKATYGRRAYGQDGPLRLRDVNWVTWDLPQFLALTAIEGQRGFDPEAYEQGRRTVRAFLDFGIDSAGQMWESNGKSGGGFQFQFLSMVALARRGENLFGHPHLRKLLEAQVQCTFPNGELTVSGGTFSGTAFALQSVNELKAFYPGDRCADYLMTQATPGRPAALQSAWEPPAGVPLAEFTPERYRAKLMAKNGTQRLRLPSVTYPNFVRSVLYDTDWVPTTKQDLGLPLDWSNERHGVFVSSSDLTPEATWISMLVRPNHYMGAGHHHSDAGMFQFAALGVNWVTEAPFNMTYDGKYHNQVIVDGESQPGQFPSRGKYLGAVMGKGGASAGADLTYAYSWRWSTQPDQVWSEAMRKLAWELEPAEDVQRIYAGTARYKMRPWWPSYTYSNFIATSRAPFNPMEYVYRSVGLVRGEKPYGLVVDDLKKDGSSHLYQWTAILGPGVWTARVEGVPTGAVVLGFRAVDPNAKVEVDVTRPALEPVAGDPLLMVVPLGGVGMARVDALAGPTDRAGKPVPYNRVTIDHRGQAAEFRVALVPFRFGEALPEVGTGVTFSKDGNRTLIKVIRGNEVVLETK